jgi:hypothetical protein
MNPRVKKANPLNNYKLKVTFSDNSQGIFDCSQYLEIGVFKELKNVKYFNQVKVIDGTVVWPHEQDFCPDTIFLDTKFKN